MVHVFQEFFMFDADCWCNSKSTDYCTSGDAMEEDFHFFSCFFHPEPLLFHRILQNCT